MRRSSGLQLGREFRAGSQSEVGQSVAARWTDRELSLAHVTAVDGNDLTVQYIDDGSKRTCLSRMSGRFRLGLGPWEDKVLAVWSSGRFYDGVITRAGDDSCEVRWADGSAPSDVPVDRIVAQ